MMPKLNILQFKIVPGDEKGVWHLQLCYQRGACRGKNSKISWTQVETG